ncbi:hypothetical protein LZ30DRAFT_550084, partial [Colletotrichum cereale]
WRSRSNLTALEVSQTPVLEAIMLYERGNAQSPDQQCSRCQKGQGPVPECVKIPDVHNGACSNCIMARASSHPEPVSRPTRSYSAEQRLISATMS